MGKDKEPLDSLVGRIGLGIHQAAIATIAAPASTREELDLAALILRRDPAQSAPRESASSVETFNRLLDVAIDSANNSAHCGTRAERRARLAADLGKAAAILLDCSYLAELIEAKLELDALKLGAIAEAPGPLPLLEQLEDAEREDERTFEEITDELGCCNLSCDAMFGRGHCEDCGRDPEPRVYQPALVEND